MYVSVIGKSSLKKTMFGEPYNPAERASSGIHADPSITRIKFKQYREWIQQPASKADTHRLNLEYIDTIIDYVLNFLKQGRVRMTEREGEEVREGGREGEERRERERERERER